MSQFVHPVAGADLLLSPELQLRHPAEREQTAADSSYDEGVGVGYDNHSPDAYAERWVEVDAGAAEVIAWFVERLADLGWTPLASIPTSGVASLWFQRDADESVSVLLQGFGEWYLHADRDVNWGRGQNHLRVTFSVSGEFSDQPDPS